MPSLAPLASGLGGALGGLAEQGIAALTKPKKKPPKRRKPNANDQKILAEGRAMAQRTGIQAYAQDAVLRVQRPADYKRLRAAGKLPSQIAERLRAAQQSPAAPRVDFRQFSQGAAPAPTPAAPTPAPAPTPAAVPPEPRPNFAALFEGLDAAERAHLELAIQEGRGAETWRQIHAARSPQPATSAAATFVNDEPSPMPELDGYSETSGLPDARPRPRKHLAILPLQQGQLEGLLRGVPTLQKLDKRLLRLLAGRSSVARDVAGVDPASGVYHAAPGETAYGIAKKLTGSPDRVAELVAANPGNQGPVWQLPPGWLMFERDTAAPVTTARRYTVLQNDTPYGIAKKLGALPSRPKWWSELKAANPHKPTKDNGGNWESLYAGEEIGIPDEWAASGSIPNGTPPAPPSPIPSTGPGLPAPGQTGTMDPGIYLQAQALLALWAKQNPGACVPADFGLNPTDFTGTATPRTSMALASFQAWWNKARPSSPLRADGVLDELTYRALFTVTAAQVPTPTPAPTPTPTLPGLPQLPDWLGKVLGGSAPIPPANLPQPAPIPTPQIPVPQLPQQIPPWLEALLKGTAPNAIPAPQVPPQFPSLPVPQFPSPPIVPATQPTTEDDGSAVPFLTMLGAGLFLA
ncbi:LysM peptidoglycan-binding domain-containing protein [Polyangium fumosum]|uniref:LysM peptidoglycan-binding domain-containing protein n=1 Tax=Polyangium fumosum TaxID=889272 RepID=A0A4U1ILG7_9BACT|nr:LysM peptidoglycan-binding domain-containing protein [Polyangium fumosum]TKC94583.1 LysM peptidoglycan-binding domain-containing protein [Polyangium fumosum]